MKRKKYIYTSSCHDMDMQKMLFKIFTKKVKIHSSVFLFPVSNIAGYWEEVLITDICYIKTTRKEKGYYFKHPIFLKLRVMC